MYETINIIYCIAFVASLYVSWILDRKDEQGQFWIILILLLGFINPYPLLISTGVWLCLYEKTYKTSYIFIAIYFIILSFSFKEMYY